MKKTSKILFIVSGVCILLSAIAIGLIVLCMNMLVTEPVVVSIDPVITPADASNPAKLEALCLIDNEGRVCITLKSDSLGQLPADMLNQAVLRYNSDNPSRRVELTPEQVKAFTRTPVAGMPIAEIGEWLDNGANTEDLKGIPMQCQGREEELSFWIRALKEAYPGDLDNDIMFNVKSDMEAPYGLISETLEVLQTHNIRRFQLMTSLKDEDE